jgi:hypothetical protein
MGSSAGAWLALPQANTAPLSVHALRLCSCSRAVSLGWTCAWPTWRASASASRPPGLRRRTCFSSRTARPPPASSSCRARRPWCRRVAGLTPLAPPPARAPTFPGALLWAARARGRWARAAWGRLCGHFPQEMPLPTSERARTHACRPFPPRQVSSYIVHKNHDEALARRPPKEFYNISYSSE